MSDWPRFPVPGSEETRPSLHSWSQIVGKVRMALTPPLNHYWHVPLYVSARGLTTSPIPYRSELFDMEFNFLTHQLEITTSGGQRRALPLRPTSVASFYTEVMRALRELQIEVRIWPRPVEVADPVPFQEDTRARAYDPQAAHTFWRVLVQTDRVFKQFRGRFLGKVSPVHFFWGAYDLAVTRFSGRRAPMWNGSALNVNPHVMHESYSHEVSSAGFWPGNDSAPPTFYSYAVPEPAGFRLATMPRGGTYSEQLGEFVLPYDAVQAADDPDMVLLDFLQRSYEAAADLGKWDRVQLEDRPACQCDLARAEEIAR